MALWPSFPNFFFKNTLLKLIGRQVWDYIKEVIDWLTRFLVDNFFYHCRLLHIIVITSKVTLAKEVI